ncbi:DUF1295 domain-containing protein [Nocardia yamanashiensis]|uniref:DUF1295 domain-containing protein n=1 Tax=Nocardia yamanashiensis TaxID=209247 RepID=UPI00082D3749|nr:DUF1295 domain-containing protein [Nocardia yamanashiensis]
MNAHNMFEIGAASALVVAIVQITTFLVARRLGRYNIVDVVWGLGFGVVAVVAAVVGDGSGTRRWLLAALVGSWGLRLSLHLRRRVRGQGEDPRYAALLERHGRTPAVVFTRIFLAQGVLQWVISLPIQVSAAAGPARGFGRVAVAAGVLVWAIGFVFEAVGDRQLARFKADPGNRGRIMDRGLWAWTRHPNYFGDCCVWWGIWLIAAGAWPGPLTVFAPMIMSYLLIRGSGARLLEQAMSDRPGYREYQARTSAFFPRPAR